MKVQIERGLLECDFGEWTGEQLKVLTFLSAVLLPMTLIVGMFGTNFKLAEYDAVEPFYVMLGSMVLLAIGMLWFFRAKRWL